MKPFCHYCGATFSNGFTPITDGDTLFCSEGCKDEKKEADERIDKITFEKVQQEYESMKTYFPYTNVFQIHINRLDCLFSYIKEQEETIQTLQKALSSKE